MGIQEIITVIVVWEFLKYVFKKIP